MKGFIGVNRCNSCAVNVYKVCCSSLPCFGGMFKEHTSPGGCLCDNHQVCSKNTCCFGLAEMMAMGIWSTIGTILCFIPSGIPCWLCGWSTQVCLRPLVVTVPNPADDEAMMAWLDVDVVLEHPHPLPSCVACCSTADQISSRAARDALVRGRGPMLRKEDCGAGCSVEAYKWAIRTHKVTIRVRALSGEEHTLAYPVHSDPMVSNAENESALVYNAFDLHGDVAVLFPSSRPQDFELNFGIHTGVGDGAEAAFERPREVLRCDAADGTPPAPLTLHELFALVTSFPCATLDQSTHTTPVDVNEIEAYLVYSTGTTAAPSPGLVGASACWTVCFSLQKLQLLMEPWVPDRLFTLAAPAIAHPTGNTKAGLDTARPTGNTNVGELHDTQHGKDIVEVTEI
jgi:hypothetical protein